MHLPRRRSGARPWRRAKCGGVVACGVVAGRGELPGSSSAGDGHACSPRALAVRAIHDDPAVSSDGGLLAQRARRRDACVETLVQQARTQIMSGIHGHVFLELRCASDSELAAAVVEHSVAIRVTSFEDLQLVSTRRALRHLLRICKAYDVVVDIWVSIPCTAGTPFRRINEKLGAETGDLAMTYKLVVAAVGLRRRAVRIGDGFSWKWSNGNELWKLVVVRNLFARCGSSSCLVSTAAVGQQFVDREGGVFCVKKKWKIVTTRPMLIEVMAPYARIPKHLGPEDFRPCGGEGLRSSALSGFSSGCRDPATTAAVDDLTVLRTPREEWKFLCLFRRLSLNSLRVCAITVREDPNLHVNSEMSQT